MSSLGLILLSVMVFTIIVLLLVSAILFAQWKLVPRGDATLMINDNPQQTLTVPMGGKLLYTLAGREIFLPSACGGGGSCGQCKVIVQEGGGDILSTERSKLNRRQIRDHYRLSCQVPVKDDMRLTISAEVFESRKWVCTVRSNHNVATYIKELILELPKGEELHFRAGGYIQMEAPPHRVCYKDFIIENEYKPEWVEHNLLHYVSEVEEPVVRAYSLANYPGEKGMIMLNVRIATPPPSSPDAPPGQLSSYIFSLKPGDRVTLSGPYGDFFAKETNNEMVFVGGGAGMAPMRSHIFDQLKRIRTDRKMTFWYGARSLREAFYREDFDKLQEDHDNFEWHLALSEPCGEDEWDGYIGFIHQCLFNLYLKDHSSPEDCEYYLCGPPLMIAAVTRMLDQLGVEPENILYDDFGG